MNKALFTSLFLLVFLNLSSQGVIKKFIKLSRPEKCWVVTHPFRAGFALSCANEARLVTDTLSLDDDKNGGQLDAFRHAYWMALLSQKISVKKATRLGDKHEKGNYLDFKKRRLEDGSLPDSVSCLMDIKNNKVGAEIGFANKDLSKRELIGLLKDKILNGDLWVISKNAQGAYLDCDGNIINVQKYKGTWGVPKCLKASNK